MVKIKFLSDKGDLDLIRNYRKVGCEILCEPKGKIDKNRKVCILFDPTISGDPKRINEWCQQINPESVIYILIGKKRFFEKYPFQRFKLPLEE